MMHNLFIPNPEGLATAADIQRLIHPAQVLLVGSRAVGDHRPDSDIDLMAICPDAATQAKADQTLEKLLHGQYDVPIVNVITITQGRIPAESPPGPIPSRPIRPVWCHGPWTTIRLPPRP